MSSATATSVLAKPAFQMEVVGRMGKNYDVSKSLAEAHRQKVRDARYSAELEAIEYAQIMLQRHIQEALDPATDPRLRRDLRNDIMNRGLGKVREQESESAEAKRQGSGAQDFLEALATVSRGLAASEAQARGVRDVTPSIEHDGGPIDTDQQAEAFLRGLHDGTLIEGSDDEP